MKQKGNRKSKNEAREIEMEKAQQRNLLNSCRTLSSIPLPLSLSLWSLSSYVCNYFLILEMFFFSRRWLFGLYENKLELASRLAGLLVSSFEFVVRATE